MRDISLGCVRSIVCAHPQCGVSPMESSAPMNRRREVPSEDPALETGGAWVGQGPALSRAHAMHGCTKGAIPSARSLADPRMGELIRNAASCPPSLDPDFLATCSVHAEIVAKEILILLETVFGRHTLSVTARRQPLKT